MCVWILFLKGKINVCVVLVYSTSAFVICLTIVCLTRCGLWIYDLRSLYLPVHSCMYVYVCLSIELFFLSTYTQHQFKLNSITFILYLSFAHINALQWQSSRTADQKKAHTNWLRYEYFTLKCSKARQAVVVIDIIIRFGKFAYRPFGLNKKKHSESESYRALA